MAIDINNGLIIHCGDHTGYEDASWYIRSLLNLLKSVTDDSKLQTEDVYYICDLIGKLLPSHTEFYEAENKK